MFNSSTFNVWLLTITLARYD